MEFCSGGSLSGLVEGGPIEEPIIRRFACEITYGLEYLYDAASPFLFCFLFISFSLFWDRSNVCEAVEQAIVLNCPLPLPLY
jgi:serine/threonine protein kinase